MDSKWLYETEYKKAGHFSFGRNWQSFLKSLSPKRIKIAEDSLEFLLGKGSIEGKSFIDIGCGSGVFSLAAHRLKADRVVSVDVDESSVACVRFLHKEEGAPKNWEIKEGSALETSFIKTLGQFDIVYSWGVLHHTGSMYPAIKNVSQLVKPDGKLYIAIYHRYTGLMHGKSTFWLKIKKQYNQHGLFGKQLYFWIYSTYLFLGLCLTLKNPFSYIRNYQSMRGMSWRHDILDWLGGYPYEFATPEEVVRYMGNLGFTLQNSRVFNTIACNEYVFVRSKPVQELPPVTVLLAVHNSVLTLDKALESVSAQTLESAIVCVDDASTDGTSELLKAWQKKLGKRLTVVTNTHNIGLTKSLNKGLKRITTPYTARIDADDWWEPMKLEKQIQFLVANPDYGVVGCWYTNYTHRTQYLVMPAMRDEVMRPMIIHRNPFAHSCVVFRTKLVQKLGGYDPKVRYGQDYELWLRCLPHTKFFNIPENLCHRLFTGGISIEKQHEQMRYAIKTRLTYIRRYHLPLSSYRSIIEPWIVRLTPRWLADLKRKISAH